MQGSTSPPPLAPPQHIHTCALHFQFFAVSFNYPTASASPVQWGPRLNVKGAGKPAGVLTSDPRMVSLAAPIPLLTFDEATELAYFGAAVLHPSAMQPALQSGALCVRVKNSYNRRAPAVGWHPRPPPARLHMRMYVVELPRRSGPNRFGPMMCVQGFQYPPRTDPFQAGVPWGPDVP